MSWECDHDQMMMLMMITGLAHPLLSRTHLTQKSCIKCALAIPQNLPTLHVVVCIRHPGLIITSCSCAGIVWLHLSLLEVLVDEQLHVRDVCNCQLSDSDSLAYVSRLACVQYAVHTALSNEQKP